MRIAIVNDVGLAVEAVRRAVLSSRDYQVAWIARDGAEAAELCARDTPDLILMDLLMPKVDGVEATRRIMAANPCAILVVTANVTDNRSKVFEAMGAGALDAVNTPVWERGSERTGAGALLAKIATIRKLVGPGAVRRRAGGERVARPPPSGRPCLVAIGASAGGPAALARLLPGLPPSFPAAVVVVQHVDEHFAPALAEWLDGQSSLPVRLAREGDRPEPGTVLLAGRDDHLVFTSATRLGYTRHPADCSYRPSVDVFFQSADRCWAGDIVGVLLTGMGRDGAEGLRALRRSGHHTIAQDRASSAVYGMPKAAADVGAASEILGLDKIAARLTNMVAKSNKAHG